MSVVFAAQWRVGARAPPRKSKCIRGARAPSAPGGSRVAASTADPTRVKLSQVDGVVTSDYINANWVAGRVPGADRRYIGAQGPLPNTVIDFWRMVFETNVSVIAMLTQEIENDRIKCEHYWPDGCVSTLVLCCSVADEISQPPQ